MDGYEPPDARALASASGKGVDEVGRMTRLDLARAVVSNPNHRFLEKIAEKFRVHVYGFGSQLVPLISVGDSAEEEADGDATPPAQKIRTRLGDIRAADPSTRSRASSSSPRSAARGSATCGRRCRSWRRAATCTRSRPSS